VSCMSNLPRVNEQLHLVDSEIHRILPHQAGDLCPKMTPLIVVVGSSLFSAAGSDLLIVAPQTLRNGEEIIRLLGLEAVEGEFSPGFRTILGFDRLTSYTDSFSRRTFLLPSEFAEYED
jgi:hypothetical protein